MAEQLQKDNTVVENGTPVPESTGNNVELEDALKVVDAITMSTDAFSKEVLTEFRKRSKAIKNSISKIDSSFETIAFNLHWINAKQAYKSEGYPTIVDYANDSFGYQKSTCYSLIAVVDRFAKRDEKGALMESFDDRVKGYSVSKLSLMVNLTDAEIDTLNPSMSVRDIKKFVKELQENALPGSSEDGGKSIGEIEGDDGKVDDEISDDSFWDDVDSVINAALDSVVENGGFTGCFDRDDYEKSVKGFDVIVKDIFNKYPKAVVEVSYSIIQNNGKKRKTIKGFPIANKR